MKKIISSIGLIITLFCAPAATLAQQNDSDHLLGAITQSDLLKSPHSTWYNENAANYQVDMGAIEVLENLLSDIEIKIVMGTWCHDSKREVPRLYKILSTTTANVSTQMIALDRKKTAPTGEIDGLDITNTPTFIFYKDGRELNRIVETPVESLEKDMLKILSDKPYAHSKMNP